MPEVEAPVPRKRGRPRKHPLPELRPEDLEEAAGIGEKAPEELIPETEEKAEPAPVPEVNTNPSPTSNPEPRKAQGEPMVVMKPRVEDDGLPEKQIFLIERQMPASAVLPNNEVVKAVGQTWTIEGRFTREQVAELIQSHGGKGIYSVIPRSSSTGKICDGHWIIKNDNGELNISSLLADLYPNKARELLRAGLISPDGELEPIARTMGPAFQFQPPATETSDQPSDDEDPDSDPENPEPEDEEVARLEAEKEAAKKKQEIERQKRQLAEEQRKLHELEEERKKEEQRTEAHKARLDAREAGVLSPAPEVKPSIVDEDDEDRPMTRRQMREALERARLETENAMLKAQAGKPAAENSLAPLANMLIAASQAQTEAMKEISKNNSANEARNRESMMEMVKQMMASASEKTSSAEKQMDMLLKVMDLREDKKKGELDFMIKLMETGANLAGSGSTQGTPWWQELLGGIGQLGGVVAEKLGGGSGGAPRPMPVQQVQYAQPAPRLPAANPPESSGPAPVESLPGAVQVDPSQIANAEAVVLPGQPESSSQAQPEVPEDGGQNVEEEFKDTVAACIESIMQQKATKPAAAEWVEIAHQDLPYEIVKQIALAQDPKALLPLIEPHITLGMKLQAAALVQADPLLVPWLKAGFEELQALCQEEVRKMEPELLKPEADENNPENQNQENADEQTGPVAG